MDDFPGGPVVKTSPCNARGVGSIPGRELRPHTPQGQAKEQKNIKLKQYCNKFNKDFKNGPHKETSFKKTDMDPTFLVFLVISFFLPSFFLGFLPASDDDGDDGWY